jgi:S1-C subfamily serine protease
LTISGLGTILLLSSQSNSYSQEANRDVNRPQYSQKFNKEISPKKNINSANFKSVSISDWRSPDPKLPWSEPVLVESKFGKYLAVFDKNYKKYGNSFSFHFDKIGIISQWTNEELSIFSYEKLDCGVISGCKRKDITPVGNSIEVLVDDLIFKIYGENGNFPIPGDLMLALQQATSESNIALRIDGSVINDIGEKTSESLSLLYSIEDNNENDNNIIKEQISVVGSLPENSNIQKIVSSTTPGVVKIETNNGLGTGFIISKTGLILTNRHVVSGDTNNKVNVTFFDGTMKEAQVVKRDRMADIAILRINNYSANMNPLSLCHAQYPSVGEDVVAIGNPLSLNFTVTRGIVSGIRQTENQSLIQTDAPINPGNSGGPLLNQYGEVIGIINAKKSAMGIEGFGFAVPIIEALNNLGIQVETTVDKDLNRCGNPISSSQSESIN